MNKKFWIKKIIGFALLGVVAVILLGYVIMFLWNNVLAVVVPVAIINFWQALGLFALGKLLFGGFHGGPGRHKGMGWKTDMKEKWQGMSPEEREKLKQEWRNRCRTWRHEETKEGAE